MITSKASQVKRNVLVFFLLFFFVSASDAFVIFFNRNLVLSYIGANFLAKFRTRGDQFRKRNFEGKIFVNASRNAFNRMVSFIGDVRVVLSLGRLSFTSS